MISNRLLFETSVMNFRERLKIKGQKRTSTSQSYSIGKSKTDGKWYGWSHRAYNGFKTGDIIKPGSIGYKGFGKEYKIKSDDEAKEHAKRFAKNVS